MVVLADFFQLVEDKCTNLSPFFEEIKCLVLTSRILNCCLGQSVNDKAI